MPTKRRSDGKSKAPKPKYGKSSREFPPAGGLHPNTGGAPNIKQLQNSFSSAAEAGPVAEPQKTVKRKREWETSEINLLEMTKKARKRFRKMQSGSFGIAKEVKAIWEELRRKKCSPSTRQELLQKMTYAIKGHVKELIFAHDTSRAIECYESYGTAEHRNMLFEEVKDVVVLMCKSRYAKFIVMQILRKGTPEQKEHIIKAFNTHVVSLVNHCEAAAVVEYFYNEQANALQRSKLLQEFYSRDLALFKEDKVLTYKDVLACSSQPEKLIEDLKEMLIKMANKSVLRHSIIHHVLYEFLENADEASRSELIQALAGSLAEIVHTKDGARTAMCCIWHGTAKDRKTIIKSFKMHIVKMATDEHAYWVLLSIFDCVDDTKLVESLVINELFKSAAELALDKNGSKVLAYLVARRDSRLFHPDVINILKRGDNTITSKKDANIREEQLRKSAAGKVVQLIVDNTRQLVTCGHSTIFVNVVLTSLGEKSIPAYRKIAELLSSPYKAAEGPENQHLFKETHARFLLKKLVKHDQEKKKKENAFSHILIEGVPKKVMRSWIGCAFGCILLVSLLETGIEEVEEHVRSALAGMEDVLDENDFKSAKLLLEMLK